ncbi:hypothetical protein ACWDA7_48630 [Streptomyces sp. NPDC001156]
MGVRATECVGGVSEDATGRGARGAGSALRVRPAGVRIRRAHPGEDLPVCRLPAE